MIILVIKELVICIHNSNRILKVAELVSVLSCLRLGNFYSEGEHVERYHEKALEY